MATIDAVHRLGRSRQPLVAHLLWSEGLDLKSHTHPASDLLFTAALSSRISALCHIKQCNTIDLRPGVHGAGHQEEHTDACGVSRFSQFQVGWRGVSPINTSPCKDGYGVMEVVFCIIAPDDCCLQPPVQSDIIRSWNPRNYRPRFRYR